MGDNILGYTRPGSRAHTSGVGYIAHENMGIERISTFMALKCKTKRNSHGEAMTNVPRVI